MLKIKDNVDLKELKKFGFEKRQIRGQTWASQHTVEDFDSELCHFTNTEYHYDCGDCGIEIHTERKNNDWNYGFGLYEINIWNEFERPVSENVFDVLFDLIQAGLVEKVEGK